MRSGAAESETVVPVASVAETGNEQPPVCAAAVPTPSGAATAASTSASVRARTTAACRVDILGST